MIAKFKQIFFQQDWFTAEQTKTIMSVLNQKSDRARFVGGCVRNVLLGIEVKDIDIATLLKPKEVIYLLNKQSIKTVPTGIKHGTVTAVIDHMSFEITTLRKDIETDGRHAKVAYTDKWEEDAKRRDFTMNALYLDHAGNIYDYVGGLDDIKKPCVRFVGDPHKRIEEDYLRLLRFFRFTAWYGQDHIDSEGMIACEKQAKNLYRLSKERVGQEVKKLLMAPSPIEIIKAMIKAEIWENILTSTTQVSLLEKLLAYNGKADFLLRLASLFVGQEDIHKELQYQLCLSKKETETIKIYTEGSSYIKEEMSLNDLRKFRYYHNIYSEGLLYLAQALEGENNEKWENYIELVNNLEDISFPFSGKDLIEIGYKPGPKIKSILLMVESWWVDNGCYGTHQDCLDYLKSLNQ